MIKKFIFTVLLGLFISSNSFAGGHEMPKFDLSKFRPDFRIGILGGENASDQIRLQQCFADYATESLNVPAKIFTFKDYAGTMQSIIGRNLDMAGFGASSYAGVYIEDPTAIVPISTWMNPAGATGYYSVLVARKDSGLKSLEDMAGKKLGYADPNSTSGFLIPSTELTSMGINEDFFESVNFMGGHEPGVLGVLNGDVDASFTWVSGVGKWEEGYSNGNLRRMVDKGILNMDDLVQLWSSSLIPEGPQSLSTDLPIAMIEHMRNLLEWIHANDKECSKNIAYGEIKQYVDVDHSFYEGIVAARLAKIGG